MIEIQADEISAVPGGVSIQGKSYRLVAVEEGNLLTTVGCSCCAFLVPGHTCLVGNDDHEAKFIQVAGDSCVSFNGGYAYWEEFSLTSTGDGFKSSKEIHDITKSLCR